MCTRPSCILIDYTRFPPVRECPAYSRIEPSFNTRSALTWLFVCLFVCLLVLVPPVPAIWHRPKMPQHPRRFSSNLRVSEQIVPVYSIQRAQILSAFRNSRGSRAKPSTACQACVCPHQLARLHRTLPYCMGGKQTSHSRNPAHAVMWSLPSPSEGT
jgi:hypothetical protein